MNPSSGERLKIEYRPIESLKPNPNNPRIHSDKQLKQIANSIKEFGFNVPVLIDADSRIIAGHGRVEAAKRLGFAQVPTISLEHLTEAQARAFLIADNRLTENSVWDDRLLGKELKALSELDLSFSLEITGFEMPEIDLLIQDLDSSSDENDPADEIPELSKSPVSRPGDLFLLGSHRLLCADALEQQSYNTLLESKRAALVFTDPPYNVPIEHHVCGKGEIQHSNFVMASGEMNEAEFTAFLTRACALQAKHSAEGSIHFV
jgi:ParB-like chromosome segregation protein Spo0J